MCSSEHCREAWNLARALLAGGDRALLAWAEPHSRSTGSGCGGAAVRGEDSGAALAPGSKQWVRGTGATAASSGRGGAAELG